MKRRLDPEVYGGAVLLWPQWHRHQNARFRARARAVSNAIRVAAEEIRHDINQKLLTEIKRANERLAAAKTEPAATVHAMTPAPSKRFKNPRAKFDFKGRTCSITGVGSYVPEKIVTNADLEKLVDTTDEWITSRTGIKARRVAAQLTSSRRTSPPTPLCAR